MSQRPADYLQLRGLELDCIVGVRPPERTRPQRIRLDVTLGLGLSLAGRSGRFSHTVDYARVADEITALLRFREYRLIEMATEEMAAMLFAAHPALESLEIRLEKPEALRGRALACAVNIARTRQQFRATRSPLPGGHEDCVLETQEARLSLLTLRPDSSLDALTVIDSLMAISPVPAARPLTDDLRAPPDVVRPLSGVLSPAAARALCWVTQGTVTQGTMLDGERSFAAPSEPLVLERGLKSGPEGATLFMCQLYAAS
ncbi:MAG TPA: dihydroneopterin aldolase [Polyangiaceae bacterium]|nr:dihydroneopterin aldolase [Polyangiaceae bacterium]